MIWLYLFLLDFLIPFLCGPDLQCNISCLDGSFLEYLPMVQGVWGSIPGGDFSPQIALEEDRDIFGQQIFCGPFSACFW